MSVLLNRVMTVVLLATFTINVSAISPPGLGDHQVPLRDARQVSEVADLSLLDVLRSLTGIAPRTPADDVLRQTTQRLDALPEQQQAAADTILRALATTLRHQQQALDSLTPEELAAVMAIRADSPLTSTQQAALQKVDSRGIATALGTLLEAANSLASAWAAPEPKTGASAGLARMLGVEAPTPPPMPPAATAQDLLEAINAISRLDAVPAEGTALKATLERVPPTARSALVSILKGLEPLHGGVPEDAERVYLELATRVDSASETLRVWSAAAAATEYLRLAQDTIGPDAPHRGDQPDLRAQLPDAHAARGRSPSLADALSALSATLGLPPSSVPDIPLEPEARAAIAETLFHADLYIQAARKAAALAPPASLSPDALSRWAQGLAEGYLPASGTQDAADLLEAAEYLHAQVGVAQALDRMLSATEDLVPRFAAVSAHACEEAPVPEQFVVPWILNLDPCGADNAWTQQALLTVDAGGDDKYLHRAAAPFAALVGVPAFQVRTIPVALVVDLGGSDQYDADGASCSQGAACPDHADAGADVVATTAPVSVLIDWDGPGAASQNSFLAGDRSQGYAAGQGRTTNILNSSPGYLQRAYGILVEQVGQASTLTSTYVAGPSSQGSAQQTGAAPDAFATTGLGVFTRLVGSGSASTASFTAGDFSQGYAQGVSVLQPFKNTGVFINAGGADVSHHDTYVAGASSQGAVIGVATAVFMDVVGPNSRSDDRYLAGEGSRGAGTGVFLDILAPPAPDLEDSMTTDVEGGVVAVEPRSGSGSSNDWYSRMEGGQGSDGMFLDVGGTDEYNGHESARNDADWGLAGRDSALFQDADRDLFPAQAERAWHRYVGLWDASDADPDASPLGGPARILIDLDASSAPNSPHTFVLSVLGDSIYGPEFSATVHLDLAGNDIYLGRTGAAFGIPPGFDASRQTGNLAADLGLPVIPPGGEEDEPPLSATAPKMFAFHLDVQGDDRYVSDIQGNQGFGQGGAVGILIDLVGSDTYHAPRAAQGVGDGGTGILIDAGPGGINRFRAASPSQGSGVGIGGVGILGAVGDHNSMDDGEIAGERLRPGSTGVGVSMNVATQGNEAPVIVDTTVPGPQILEAGMTYTFDATADDADGDDLTFCWFFEESSDTREACQLVEHPGTGPLTAREVHVWDDVATDGRGPEPRDLREFSVRLEVSDNGGKVAEQFLGPFVVRNEPIQILGPVRSIIPLGTPHPIDTSNLDPIAFQVPIPAEAYLEDLLFNVDWGDGSSSGSVSPSSIDWARALHGAVPIQLLVGDARPCIIDHPDPMKPSYMMDGDPLSRAQFSYGSTCPAAAAVVRLAGPRAVDLVVVEASIEPTSSEVPLAVDALLADGGVHSLGTALVTKRLLPASPEPQRFELPVGPVPSDLVGLRFRQLDAQNLPPFEDRFFIHSLQALGPGIEHMYAAPGNVFLDFEVIDGWGGRNGATLPLRFESEKPELPFTLVTVGSRGPVRHASLAADTEYRVTIEPKPNESGGPATNPGGQACILWGDEAETCADASSSPLWFRHAWDEAGPVEVLVQHRSNEGEVLSESKVFDAFIEQDALDLFLDLAPGDPSGTGHLPVLPILYMSLGDEDTWYSGEPYMATLDLGGNDRYVGPVAVPSRSLAFTGTSLAVGQPEAGARPSLLVDLAGDDVYLSTVEETQGFGRFGAAALLFDLQGSDIYVAPGRAQGAAQFGAGALVDLGGDDWFNAISAWDAAVLAAMPHNEAPIIDRTRMMPARPLQGDGVPRGDLVQGAGLDGLGVLLSRGGRDVFGAGDRSQGYGGHGVNNPTDYVLADPGCNDPAQPYCILGLKDFQPDPNQGGFPADSGALQAFLLHGPRYGPGAGFLLRGDGASLIHGGDHVQAAADPSGRGLLVIPDGGGLLSAGSDAQGRAVGGQAGLVAGAANVLRMERRGHGLSSTVEASPEPVARSHAAFAVTDNTLAVCTEDCPGAGALPDVTAQLSPQAGFVSIPATIEESTALEVQVVSAQPHGIELAAYSVVTPWAADGTCNASQVPLRPPTAISSTDEGDGTFGLQIDPGEMLDDGPRHPAGCTMVHVFSRHIASGQGASGWSRVSTGQPIIVAPPLHAELVGSTIASSGSPVDFAVHVPQPMAASRFPVVEVHILPTGQQPDPASAGMAPTDWRAEDGGATAVFTWDPSGDPDGGYSLWFRGRWAESHPVDSWQQVNAVVLLDGSGPEVLLETITPPGPGSSHFRVAGKAIDPSGVADINVRLVGEDGSPILLSGGVTSVNADLFPSGGTNPSWEVALSPAPAFAGGSSWVQVRATDLGGGITDWHSLGWEVVMDRSPPEIGPVRTPEGRAATNSPFPVPFEVFLNDKARRDCIQDCPPGAGVDEGSVYATIQVGGQPLPLQLQGFRQEAEGLVAEFAWPGPAGEHPADGPYYVSVQANDLAGNLRILNPGTRITADSLPPVIRSVSQDLAYVKPGDVLTVTADILDPTDVASGIREARAYMLLAEAAVIGPSDGQHQIPLIAAGPSDHNGPATVRIEVEDEAGNTDIDETLSVVFYGTPPAFTSQEVSTRADSLRLDADIDRSVEFLHATAAAGGSTIDGLAVRQDGSWAILFSGLEGATPYDIEVVFEDAAGWQLTWSETLSTLPVNEGTLSLTPLPAGSYSGVVPLSGSMTLQETAPATLTLHVVDPETPPVQVVDFEPFEGSKNFQLSLDSTLVGDGPATLIVVMDDGSKTRSASMQITIDNTAPLLDIGLEAPPPHGTRPWYNGPVQIKPVASDTSSPAVVSIEVNGKEVGPTAMLTADGVHEITVWAQDAASPPNRRYATFPLAIDQTLPSIAVLPSTTMTNQLVVPIHVTASDATSGIQAYRTREDGAWSAWSPDRPSSVSLADGDDGPRFLSVEVRDAAGNVQRSTQPILVDREPPRLLAAKWLAWSDTGQPVLHIVAEDRIGAAGVRSAGVEAVRFAAPGGAWSQWFATNGNQAHGVPLTHYASLTQVQLRDHAGNIGAVFSTVENKDLPGDEMPLPPSGEVDLVTDITLSPPAGGPTTSFAFSALVRASNGAAPMSVWIELRGERHPMESSGPTLQDGGRLYVFTTTLPPTRLTNPHEYRIVVDYGSLEVASAMKPGPLVELLGDDAELTQDASLPKDQKAPAAGLLLGVILLVLARRRRSLGGPP